MNNENHDNPAIERINSHERLCAVNSSNNLFFHNKYFNYKYGSPLIKFSLFSHILKYSNNVPREQLVQRAIIIRIIRDHTIIRETSTDNYPFGSVLRMSDEYSYMQFRFLCTMLHFHLALLRANTVSINSLNIAEAYSLLRSSSINERNKFGYFYENPETLKLVLLLLLLSGDIERNPGHVMTQTQILRITQSKENYLKFVHLNFQDIQKQQNGSKNLSNDLGLNTVLAITEMFSLGWRFCIKQRKTYEANLAAFLVPTTTCRLSYLAGRDTKHGIRHIFRTTNFVLHQRSTVEVRKVLFLRVSYSQDL